MNIAIRVDANQQIGTGHLMRTLTLANQFKCRGHKVFMLMQSPTSNAADLIKELDLKLIRLPPEESAQRIFHTEDIYPEEVQKNLAFECITALNDEIKGQVDLLILDNYSLSHHWESTIRKAARSILVIDDLANRPHDCDFLVDQNLVHNFSSRYSGKVSEKTKLFLGPSYALINSKYQFFRNTAERSKSNSSIPILVSFGGADSTHETKKFIECLSLESSESQSKLFGSIVIGPNFQDSNVIEQKIAQYALWKSIKAPKSLAEHMNRSSLFIGAGGSTTWERFCLGLPSIVIATAPNQIESCEYLAHLGLINYLGFHTSVTKEMLYSRIKEVISSPEKLIKSGLRGQSLVDGQGTNRVVDSILTYLDEIAN